MVPIWGPLTDPGFVPLFGAKTKNKSQDSEKENKQGKQHKRNNYRSNRNIALLQVRRDNSNDGK